MKNINTKVNKEEAVKLIQLAYELAKKSYEIKKDNFLYKTSIETNDEFIILKNEKNTSWDILLDSKNNSNGYKAVAFLNNETKEVHIATAGTVPTDINDLRDDVRITAGYTPRKITPMKIFVEDVIKKLGDDFLGYKFSTSGHSLGAVISDLTAAELISRGLNFDKSITFENPGSKKVMKTAISNKVFSGTKDVVIEEISNQCVEYNAKPNFINTMGNHLAKNINLVLPKNSQKPQEIEKSNLEPIKSSSSGLFGFGKYIYNKAGSAINTLSEKSGINSVLDQINQHSLKNFENMDSDSVIYKVSDYGNGKLRIDPLEIGKVENIIPTGNEIEIDYEKDIDNGFTILDSKQFAFNDLIRSNLGSYSSDEFDFFL